MLWRTNFKSLCTFSHALNDPDLLGKVFEPASYWPWRDVVAKLIDGLPLTEPREIALFEECVGRPYNRQAHRAVCRNLTLLVGMRGGKDRIMSAAAMWRAGLQANWKKHISAGEGAVCLLIGRDRGQAHILFDYCHGLLDVSPELKKRVSRITNDTITFKNAASVEIATADASSIRGRSVIGVFASEVSHWNTNENADEEIISSAMHGTAMCPDPAGGLLICGSSVNRKIGYMWRKFKERDSSDDVVWFAPTLTMNPACPERIIHEALTTNQARANADFFCIWRDDSNPCFALDEIEKSTDVGIRERPRISGCHYYAYVDAGRGVEGGASFTLAIAHRKDNVAVLDLIKEQKAPYSPLDVVGTYAQVLKAWGIHVVFCDSHEFEPLEDEWRRHLITAKKLNRTIENYLIALPLLRSGRFRLLDDNTLKSQLSNLEYGYTARGNPTVDCPAHARDDVAAAAIGALVAASRGPSYDFGYAGWQPEADDPIRPMPPPSFVSPDGNWWRSMPRSGAYIASADDELRHGYQSLLGILKNGGQF